MIYFRLYCATIEGVMMKLWSAFIVSLLLMAPAMQANAQNKPCSGKMGGVSHCEGGKFVCKNGKISQSKRVCNG